MAQPSLYYKVRMSLTLMITTVHLRYGTGEELNWCGEKVESELMLLRFSLLLSEDGSGDTADGEGAVEAKRRTQAKERLREQHAQRLTWIRDYVERVRNVEYTDELYNLCGASVLNLFYH
jgi:hypothetical protein